MTIRRHGTRGQWLAAGLSGALLLLSLGSLAQREQQPQTPPKLVELERRIRASGGADLTSLDRDMALSGLQVRSMVPELACTSDGPAGPVTHIPVAINTTPAGRVSILKLQTGQSTLAGMYVVNGEIFERHVTRRTGTGPLAAGDLLEERITEPSGPVVQTLSYKVRSVDHQGGSFRAANFENITRTGDVINGQDGWCWFCNGGSSWWCGFPCFPDMDEDGPGRDQPTTAVVN